jgi:TolA-binding protein
MWRGLLLSLCFLFFLPAVWSQESSSLENEGICCEKWKQVEELQRQLSNLQTTHDLTLKAGLAQQLQQKKRLTELMDSLTKLQKELETANDIGEKLSKKIKDLEQQLRASLEAQDKAISKALGLELEKEILWVADGVIGAGLVVYGIWKQDWIPIAAGAVMCGSSILHFILTL